MLGSPLGSESWNVMFTECNVNRFDLAVELEAVMTTLAPYAGVLHPSERYAQVAYVLTVDPNHAGIDRLGDVVCLGEVAAPHVAGEPVAHVVRELDRLLGRGEPGCHQHGPEDLLLEDTGGPVHIGEQRRLEEVPVRQVARALPTDHQSPFLHAGFDVAHDALVVLGMDQRSKLRRHVCRVA